MNITVEDESLISLVVNKLLARKNMIMNIIVTITNIVIHKVYTKDPYNGEHGRNTITQHQCGKLVR